MKSPDYVLYIPGVGNEPPEQEHLAELWQPYGLTVENCPIDWTDSNLEDKMDAFSDRVVQLSSIGRVSLVGASGGGKVALSLFARVTESIHKVVTISAKMDPYIISDDTQKKYPNLVLSSNALPRDLEKINADMRKDILCIHPLGDNVVRPEDAVLEGAHELVVPTYGHIPGIQYALTIGGNAIAEFIRQDDTSV